MHSLNKLSVRQFRSINSKISWNLSRKQHLCTANDTIDKHDRTAHFGFKTVRETEKADKGLQKQTNKIELK